jgi:hypothetical protein
MRAPFAARTILAFFIGAALHLFMPGASGQTNTSRSLGDLQKRADFIKPKPEELRGLEEIPWVLSLVEGQQLARKEKRPIFLWVIRGSLDGNGPKLLMFPGWYAKPEVAKLIKENFIPVACNWYTAETKLPEVAAFRRQAWEQGASIRKADGEVLAAVNNYRLDTTHEYTVKGMLQMMHDSLEKVDKQPARQAKARTFQEINPDRGVGVRADKSVRLSLTSAFLYGQPASERRTFPHLDGVVLTAEQFSKFLPADNKVGARYEVPETVCRQFANAIAALPGPSMRPEHLDLARMTGEVVEIKDGQGSARLTGKLRSPPLNGNPPEEPGYVNIEGFVRFDLEGNVQSLLLLLEGSHRRKPPHNELQRTAAVAEWSRANGKPSK